MIYYTGDIHGREEKIMQFIFRNNLTGEDVIVILGDAGFNYYGLDDSRSRDRIMKETVNRTGVKVFCIHGNHERRPESLPCYQETDWRSGRVYIEDEFPNLLFAKDGDVYDMDGHRAIVIGGAYSVDKYYRLQRGLNWFDDEQPSESTKIHVESVLDGLCWNVDTILSHTCPRIIK